MSGIRQFEKYLMKHSHEEGAIEALTWIDKFLSSRPPNRKPRRATSSPVTEEMAKRVIELNDNTNMAQHQIARLVGTNQGRVNEILKNR